MPEIKRYPSRFGGGQCTAQQYLAELMVARQASKRGVALPDKFWSLPRYERDYKLQVRHASAILKLYSFEVILKVLQGEAKNAFSLGAKWLHPLFKYEEKLQNAKETKKGEVFHTPPPQEVRPAFGGKSSLSKLRKLDA